MIVFLSLYFYHLFLLLLKKLSLLVLGGPHETLPVPFYTKYLSSDGKMANKSHITIQVFL